MKKIFLCLLLVFVVAYCANHNENLSLQETVCAKCNSEIERLETETVTSEYCFSQNSEIDLAKTAKSAYITDASGKVEVYSKNSSERLTIASMTKIMLLNLVFDAVDKGELSLDEEITVSERANSMGGSQVFLQANKNYKASDLIKSVIVASANDASVALAERLYGSEEACVEKMNSLAKEWNLSDTLFSNCTGLPKPTQYSSAKDVAVMLSKLISHDEYFKFSNIWLDELTHPDGQKTVLTNTNKLVKFYSGCDGGKTGFTSESLYCLACTAKRDGTRIIAVVIGEPSSKERFSDVTSMLDYTFANFKNQQIVDSSVILSENVKISGGKENNVSVRAKENFSAFTKKGEKADYTYEIKQFDNLRAPIIEGQTVGEVVVYNGGIEVQKIDLVSTKTVAKRNLFDTIKDIFDGWRI